MADDKKKSNAEPTTSDNKSKGNGNGQTASATTPKGSKFAEKFNKFINLCSEMKNDSAGAIDYEKTLEENATLKMSMKRKDNEIAGLRAQIKELELSASQNLDRFGKRYAEFDARLKDAETSKKALTVTQAKLDETNDELQQLNANIKQAEKKAREADTARRTAERELAGTVDRLQGLEFKLQSAQEKIDFYGESRMVSLDFEQVYVYADKTVCESLLTLNSGDDLENFASKCHQLVMRCFNPCEAPPVCRTPWSCPQVC